MKFHPLKEMCVILILSRSVEVLSVWVVDTLGKRKKAREEIWYYNLGNGKKARQETLKPYANPDFVAVVEETRKENTINSVPTVKKTVKEKGKKKENSKKD